MSDSIDILNKKFIQNLKMIVLIYFGYLGFSPVLMFLLIGFGNGNDIFSLLVSLSIGLVFFFVGFYIIWFVYKNREIYRKDRKEWVGNLATGSFIFALGLALIGIISRDYESPGRVSVASDSVFGLIIAPVLMFTHPIFISLSSIVFGTIILVKNRQSSVTRLLFLSNLTFGGTWIVFLIYSFSFFFSTDGVNIVSILYIVFYFLFFLGVILLIHACRRIITPFDQNFPWWFSLSVGITLISTIFLSFSELTHYGFYADFIGESNNPTQLLYLREHSLIFAVVYSVSILLPIIYSVYLLSRPPNWITKDRKHWINRTRISLILLSVYPLVEGLSGLQDLPFFSSPISAFNLAPMKILLLMGSISLLYFSNVLMITGVSDVNKWFFDEIKLRATPYLQEIDPDVNLATIYNQIDEWQKDTELTPKIMTNQTLDKYVQAAKNLLLVDEVSPT